MATNVNNVSAVKPRISGCVYRAPLGTTLPTDATTALAAAFKDLGYISEDGITNSNTRESEEIKAYGGDTVLRPETGKTDSYQMTFIESKNVDTLKAVYGDDNVTGTIATGIEVRVNSKELESAVWVIDQIMNGDVLRRTVIPNGKVTDLGDITYADGEVTGFETTVTALPYADYQGDTSKIFMKESE